MYCSDPNSIALNCSSPSFRHNSALAKAIRLQTRPLTLVFVHGLVHLREQVQSGAGLHADLLRELRNAHALLDQALDFAQLLLIPHHELEKIGLAEWLL